MKKSYIALKPEEWTSECHVSWKRRQRAQDTFDRINQLVDSLMDRGVDKLVSSAKAVTEEGDLLFLT